MFGVREMRGQRLLVRPAFHDHDAVVVHGVGHERIVQAARLIPASALDVGPDSLEQRRAALRLDLDGADDQNLHGHPLLTGGRPEPSPCYVEAVAVRPGTGPVRYQWLL
jgi:hypothetical protein